MEKDFIVLDEYQQKALQAIHDFAENTFQDFPEGFGAKEEQDLLRTFQWLVQEYIELIFAYSRTFSEMGMSRKKEVYNALMRCFNPTKNEE